MLCPWDLARVYLLPQANFAECSHSVVHKSSCHKVLGQDTQRIGSAVKVGGARLFTRVLILWSADHVCRSGNVQD